MKQKYFDAYGMPGEDVTYWLINQLKHDFHTKNELLDLLSDAIEQIKAIPDQEEEEKHENNRT